MVDEQISQQQRDVQQAIELLEKWHNTRDDQLLETAAALVNPQLGPKPRVRIVLDMRSGAVQQVYQDNPNVVVTDTVIVSGLTNYPRLFVSPGAVIAGGPLSGGVVSQHLADAEVAGPELLKPVFDAAELRLMDMETKMKGDANAGAA